MALKFTNNAESTLASDITAVSTSVFVQAGEGARFPSLTVSDTAVITVQDTAGNYEIMTVTARAGDTMTVTRGAEGTTPRAFPSGSVVQGNMTAGMFSTFTTTSDLATKQPLDATLTALAGVVTAADKLVYATGVDTFATTDITPAGRALLDDASATAQRTTLGLGTVATYDIGSGAGQVPTNSMVSATPQNILSIGRLTMSGVCR